MKKFALMCENRHEFEGWFADAQAVRVQAANGLIDCPYCGSLQVQKQLSAPNLSTPKTKARIDEARINSEVAEMAALKKGMRPILFLVLVLLPIRLPGRLRHPFLRQPLSLLLESQVVQR